MSTLQIEAAIRGLSEKDPLSLDTLSGSLPPQAPAEPNEILEEAVRRDEELENGLAQPLNEEAFWAGVRRSRG